MPSIIGSQEGIIVALKKLKYMGCSSLADNSCGIYFSNCYMFICNTDSHKQFTWCFFQVDNGLARFDRVIVRAKPSEYDLMLTFTSPIEIKPRRLKMIVRNCTRGEKEVAGTAKSDFSCVKCIRKQYLFDPKGNCTDCPTDAECDGRSIIPDPGFWHSTSWSPQIHQCLFKQACDYHGRSEKMVEESWNATSALRYDEGYSQCKKVLLEPHLINNLITIQSIDCHKIFKHYQTANLRNQVVANYIA